LKLSCKQQYRSVPLPSALTSMPLKWVTVAMLAVPVQAQFVCPAGSKPKPGLGRDPLDAADCEPCPRGTYGENHNTCTNCPAGKTTTVLQQAELASQCDICKKGFFNPQPAGCTRCPAGWTTTDQGANPRCDVHMPTFARSPATAPRTAPGTPAAAQPAQMTAALAPMESMPSGVNSANSLEATRIRQGLLGRYALPLNPVSWVQSTDLFPLAAAGLIVTSLGSILAITKLTSRRTAVRPEEHSAEESLVPTLETRETNQVE